MPKKNEQTYKQQDLASLPELCTAPETARYLRTSGRTLRRYCDKHLLNYIVISGKLLFRRSAIELFLAQREIKAGENGAAPLEPANWSPRTRNKKTGRVVGAAVQQGGA